MWRRFTNKKIGALGLLFTIVFGLLASYFAYQSYILQQANNDLTQANQKLQDRLYNYTSKLIVNAGNAINVNLNNNDWPNGQAGFTLDVISPHSGYVTINQSSFTMFGPSAWGDILDPAQLEHNNVSISGNYVIPTSPNSFEKSVNLAFVVTIYLAFQYLQPSYGATFFLGSVGILTTFHDVPLGRNYTAIVEVPVKVTFHN